MRIYELIHELERRGVDWSVLGDGQMRIRPASEAKDLMEHLRKYKHWLCEYALGRYALTLECMVETVRGAEMIPFAVLQDRFPREMIDKAAREGLIIEQLNSFYRMPTEKERAERRRRAA